MHIGNRIKERRTALQLTQDELAQRCGWSTGKRSTRISLYESGHRKLKKKHIIELSIALGVSFNWLLFGKEEPSVHQEENVHSLNRKQDIQFIALKDIKLLKSRKKGVNMNINIDNDCFQSEMGGDSMISEQGKESLYDGDYLLIDPNLLPQIGDIVLFENHEGQFKIRKLIADGTEVMLKASNANFESYKFDESVLIYGVVTMVQRTVLSPRKSPIQIVRAS